MSLRPFQDFLWPLGQQATVEPLKLWGYNIPFLYKIAENTEMQELERQMMDVQTRADGNSVTFGCNVVGYAPDELKVNVEGDQLVIEGEHNEEHGGQSIHRKFTRRIKLPKGIAHESVQCNLDDKGKLIIQADFHQAEKPPSRQIPIGYKKSQEEPPKDEEKKTDTNKDVSHKK